MGARALHRHRFEEGGGVDGKWMLGRRRMEGESLIDVADWGLGWRKEKV